MSQSAPLRKIILHYHLFKNAGTSVDQVLQRNFGARWVTREFQARGNPAVHRKEVADWILAHPDACAFSSHTLELPPPQIDGVEILPVIFIRHPIDRIVSAYSFERRQGGDGFGSVLARHTSLMGYIEVRLSLWRDRQCRDFHVDRLAPMFPADSGTELQRASRAIASLPFVGVVEEFGASLAQLQRLLRPAFPEFAIQNVHVNSSRDIAVSLPERLDKLKSEIGDACFAQLISTNRDDLLLHQQALDRLKAAG